MRERRISKEREGMDKSSGREEEEERKEKEEKMKWK